jgi:hypothetical protein
MDSNPIRGSFYDNFHFLIESLGWAQDTISYGKVEGDPEVIGQRWDTYAPAGSRTHPDAFFYHFGDTSFRKLLRSIYDHRQCTRDELKKICGNEQILDEHLAYMAQKNVAVQADNFWSVSPRYEDIRGIGKTLEWYVAEWFRLILQVPARHSVHIPDMPHGGDLDVVAFLNGQKVFVECKSGNPANISNTHLELFLRRAADFNPVIALLLIDTQSKIDTQINMLKNVYLESDLVKPNSLNLERWDAGCVHIRNVEKSIAHTLRSVLRDHSSNVYHNRPLVSLAAQVDNGAFATDEERSQWINKTVTEFAQSRGFGCIVMIVQRYGEPVLKVTLSGDKTPRINQPLRTFTKMSRKELEYWLHSHLYRV